MPLFRRLRRVALRLEQSAAAKTTASSRHGFRFGRKAAFMLGGMGVGAAGTGGMVFAYANNGPAPAMPQITPEMVTASDSELPTISLDEVLKHRHPGSIWVTYEGYVYDVTEFANQHPGGRELVLTAAGLDLGHFFENYTVHGKTDKAANYLAGLRIGKLSAADAAKAKTLTNPNTHVERRLQVLAKARFRLLLVLAAMPVFILVRLFLHVLGWMVPSVSNVVADLLPFSVPGYGAAAPVKGTRPDGTRTRVAVIGGGIAGSGCAYTLARSGYNVTVYEGRKTLSGNAHTFDWDVKGKKVKTCVSVTAWPPTLYKNYVALLKQIDVKTTPIHLSWFLNSKVPGDDGFLWAADPEHTPGSLRTHFKKDFEIYGKVINFIDKVTTLLTFQVGQDPSMYSVQSGLGVLNPLATFPLHHLCRLCGVSQEWWDIVFTPHYTASFLTDKLDNFVSVAGPLIEKQIPLNPNETNAKNAVLTTCETWADAGEGIREVFRKLTEKCDVRADTRVTKVTVLKDGKLAVGDDVGGYEVFDKVVFACACNAVGNIHHQHNYVEDAILASPEYADDHHPSTGHMHAVMHNDASIIAPEYREEVLKRGSNYVEITKLKDGSINIENTYNFGVQTPSLVGKPLSEKPPMLITHALGDGKKIDPSLIVGQGNHARAHPLYSGWNVASLLSLRLAQGRNGIYYCGNYTTPGNCHDMSLNSGLNVAVSIGAEYPFEGNGEAKKDFYRLRSLMGL